MAQLVVRLPGRCVTFSAENIPVLTGRLVNLCSLFPLHFIQKRSKFHSGADSLSITRENKETAEDVGTRIL